MSKELAKAMEKAVAAVNSVPAELQRNFMRVLKGLIAAGTPADQVGDVYLAALAERAEAENLHNHRLKVFMDGGGYTEDQVLAVIKGVESNGATKSVDANGKGA